MRATRVYVPWQNGMHMSNASRFVWLVQGFRASVRVVCRGKAADARSILGLLLLGASFQTPLVIEATGEDEGEVVAAAEAFFSDADGADIWTHLDR